MDSNKQILTIQQWIRSFSNLKHPRTAAIIHHGKSRTDHDDPRTEKSYKFFIVKLGVLQVYGYNWFRWKTMDTSIVFKDIKKLKTFLRRL